jgi:hypothetical protein
MVEVRMREDDSEEAWVRPIETGNVRQLNRCRIRDVKRHPQIEQDSLSTGFKFDAVATYFMRSPMNPNSHVVVPPGRLGD